MYILCVESLHLFEKYRTVEMQKIHIVNFSSRKIDLSK